MSQRRPARTHGRDRRRATSYGPAWLRLGESGGDSPTQGKGGFAGNWQALHSTEARTVATSGGTSSRKQSNVGEHGPEHPTH